MLASDARVMLNDLGDHKVEPLLGKLRIKRCLIGERAQPGNLSGLALGVRRRHLVFGFQPADLLSAAKSLGEHVHQRSVNVVNARAQLLELRLCRISHDVTLIEQVVQHDYLLALRANTNR